MIENLLRADWEEGLGETAPSTAHLLQVTARPGPRSSVVLLAFAHGRTVPSLLREKVKSRWLFSHEGRS